MKRIIIFLVSFLIIRNIYAVGVSASCETDGTKDCDAGLYCGGIAYKSCSYCSSGYNCPIGSNTIQGLGYCIAGSYCAYGSPMKQCTTVATFCPTGSTTNNGGYPIINYSYYLNENYPNWNCEDKLCQCGAGYYCPAGSTSHMGQPIDSSCSDDGTDKCECPAGKFCSNYTGAPPNNSCYKGHFCPKTSTTQFGAPIEEYNSDGVRCRYNLADPNKSCYCLQGYYCESGSTNEKGHKSGESADNVRKCKAGFYCPTGSTYENGRRVNITGITNDKFTCERDQICNCRKGYYCEEGSATEYGQVTAGDGTINGVDKAECPAGYFCGANTGANPAGNNDTTKQCRSGYWCPKTSTHGHGRPDKHSGAVDIIDRISGHSLQTVSCNDTTSDCKCPGGTYCPQGSTAPILCPAGSYCRPGASAPIQCDQGYYCPAGASEQKRCPAGYYCTSMIDKAECAPGYFCPEGSTKPYGGISISINVIGCSEDTNIDNSGVKVCKCRAGYYCPSTSTSEFGKPDKFGEDCAGGQKTLCTCAAGSYCLERSINKLGQTVDDNTPKYCDKGYFCPETSSTSKGNPVDPTIQSNSGCNNNNYYDASLQQFRCACPAGYYCDGAAVNGTSKPCNATNGGNEYYCPPTSTTVKGNPAETISTPINYQCIAGAECACALLSGGVEPTGGVYRSYASNGIFDSPYVCRYQAPQKLPDTTDQCTADAKEIKYTSSGWEEIEYGNVIAPSGYGVNGLKCEPCKNGYYSEGGSGACISCNTLCNTENNNDNTQARFSTEPMEKAISPNNCRYSNLAPVPASGTCTRSACAVAYRESDIQSCSDGKGYPKLYESRYTNWKEGCFTYKKRIWPFEGRDIRVKCNEEEISKCCADWHTDDKSCSKWKDERIQEWANSSCTSQPSNREKVYCEDLIQFCSKDTNSVCLAQDVESAPKGYYIDGDEVGNNWCKKCAEGTYRELDTLNPRICPDCPDGKYCKGIGLMQPTGDCAEGYYCPQGSTDSTGKPREDSEACTLASCEAGDPCECGSGYFCPTGSQSCIGNPIVEDSVNCPNGICGCKAGYFCPTGSKNDQGNPVIPDADNCPDGICQCDGGYYCPPTSTDPTGKPREGYTQTPTVDPECNCSANMSCNCPSGYYCEDGTKMCHTGLNPRDCGVDDKFCRCPSGTGSGTNASSVKYCYFTTEIVDINNGKGKIQIFFGEDPNANPPRFQCYPQD